LLNKFLPLIALFYLAPALFTQAQAQDSRLIVGQATVPAFTVANATTPTPFTRITFPSPFATGTVPNVFPMTPEFGVGADDDPCTIRIQNVDNLGFDVTCLEPRNEDRNSPGFAFDYIAIENGDVSVPLADGSGNVLFESRCAFVDEQVFGPTCANCTLGPGQSQGFQSIDFVNTFTGTPALLTQIQTVNNTLTPSPTTPVGEPEFINSAVQTGSLDSTGFNVTNDRLEAGNGLFTGGEDICYLAVETDGCQELNFSTLNGPSSVFFNAVSGGNVDGHDNGATSGEGADFAAGCFSSTPVAVASQTSRRGNNGGLLRRADINADEIILTVDEDRVSNAERSHIDEFVAALAFSSTFTTPVTLSHVRFDQLDRNLSLAWQTSSETFHLGFHVWGETSQGWQQLNQRLIPAAGGNTAEARDYQTRIRLNRQQANTVSRFGLSAIDNSGHEEFYGPFEAGVDYGDQDTTEAIDWQATRAEFEARMRAKGYVERGGRWIRADARRQARLAARELGLDRLVLNLSFAETGIHRVAVSTILDEAPRWNRQPWSRLAVTLNGEAVARYVESDDDLVSADDELYFFVREPNGRDKVYLRDYQYQIQLDPTRVVDAGQFNGQLADDADLLSASGAISTIVTTDRAFSQSIKNDDPWYDARLLSFGAPARADFPLNFSQAILTDQAASMRIELFGGIDLPGDDDDHHAQILVNGTLVGDARFDGLNLYQNVIEIPANLLTGAGDEVSVVVPGDTGLLADLILVDEIQVSALTDVSAISTPSFAAQANEDYRVLADQQSILFAYTKSGALTRIEFTALGEQQIGFTGLPISSTTGLFYQASNRADLPTATSIEAHRNAVLHTSNADYWIVAHPQFINADLERFAQLKREQGFTVSIVDWLEVVASYGFTNSTPQALDRFLSLAHTHHAFDYALIVGGHTYDYRGVIDSEVVNFIPTHYTPVSIFEFSPSDNQFADLDGDNKPEFALGRWPVRTTQDLSYVIAKTEKWHQNRSDSVYQDALLIAQQQDNRGLEFDDQIRAYVRSYLAADQQIDQIDEVYMQDIIDQGLPISTAQAQIVDSINAGAEFISFAGHGSDAAWSFDSVVDTAVVKALENDATPAMVMPLACYTTNYESLTVNTLAHQWLFAGEQGAAAIHGAAVLGQYRENAVFAERYMRQAPEAATVGEAIRAAKLTMSSRNEMLNNWALLGDPALPLR